MDGERRQLDLRGVLILAFAAALLALGVTFTALPELGALLFGLRLGPDTDDGFVRALGVRDVALALYLSGLTLFSDRRSQAIVLLATAVIPASDFVLVMIQSEGRSVIQLCLHAASALASVLLGVWSLRRA
jgi:hypothetical protein